MWCRLKHNKQNTKAKSSKEFMKNRLDIMGHALLKFLLNKDRASGSGISIESGTGMNSGSGHGSDINFENGQKYNLCGMSDNRNRFFLHEVLDKSMRMWYKLQNY